MDYIIRTIDQLGKALRSQRKKQGLTQEETAKKVGLLPKTISALETAPATSTIESLLKLLAALEYDIQLIPRIRDIEAAKTSEW